MLRIFIITSVFFLFSPAIQAQTFGMGEKELLETEVVADALSEEDAKEENGEIWVSYSPPDIRVSYGGQTFCYITIKLKNNTPYVIKMIDAQFDWPKWKNPIMFQMFRPGKANSLQYRVPGSICYSLKEKPKIKVSSCLIGEIEEKECISKIKIVDWGAF